MPQTPSARRVARFSWWSPSLSHLIGSCSCLRRSRVDRGAQQFEYTCDTCCLLGTRSLYCCFQLTNICIILTTLVASHDVWKPVSRYKSRRRFRTPIYRHVDPHLRVEAVPKKIQQYTAVSEKPVHKNIRLRIRKSRPKK